MTFLNACPDCGSSDHSTIYQKQTFDLPAIPMPGGELEKLTVRYPLAKCDVCQRTYRNKDSHKAVIDAIVEHIEKKANAANSFIQKKDRRNRSNWITTGMVIGVLYAHAFNLLLRQQWIFAGLVTTMATIMVFFVFGADFIFKFAKKKKQDAIVVDDELMRKLIDGEPK